MQHVLGIPAAEAPDRDTREGEVRWIERLQLRAQPATEPLPAGGESGSWIRRLQQRAANDPL